MRTIIVQWIDSTTNIPNGFNPTDMIVISSDHPRFVKGSRFDYGFFSIAIKERYTIISLPVDSSEYEKQLKDSIIDGINKDPNYK